MFVSVIWIYVKNVPGLFNHAIIMWFQRYFLIKKKCKEKKERKEKEQKKKRLPLYNPIL